MRVPIRLGGIGSSQRSVMGGWYKARASAWERLPVAWCTGA